MAKCSVEGCVTDAKTKGMCTKHYYRQLRWGFTHDNKKMPVIDGGCTVEGCGKKIKARHLCSKHYKQLLRNGKPERITEDNRGKLCIVDGCESEAHAKGLCANHYNQKLYETEQYKEYRRKAKRKRRATEKGCYSEPYSISQVVEKTNGICGICGEEIYLDLSHPHADSLSIDHIIPLSLGGDDTIENVQPAHLSCNLRKGAKLNIGE